MGSLTQNTQNTKVISGCKRAHRQKSVENQIMALEQDERFTHREHQILAKIIAAKTNKVIAKELGISPRTVEVHRANIIQKLGLHRPTLLRSLVILNHAMSEFSVEEQKFITCPFLRNICKACSHTVPEINSCRKAEMVSAANMGKLESTVAPVLNRIKQIVSEE